jgi:xanthine dehydrogenase YagS FAD-binding subunit
MNRFEYVTPKSVKEATGLLGGTAAAKAGGTDLVARMKDRLDAPARLVNLLDLKELRGVTADDGGLKAGALVTLAELAAHPAARKWYAALAQAAAEAATPQVRNVATVGGNLCQRPRCWYFRAAEFHCLKKGGEKCFALDGENQYHAIFGGEKCPIVHPSNLGPALVALDGKVHVAGKEGARVVAAADFFASDDVARENTLKEGELVTAIEAPAGWRSAYVEVREKQSFDWPLVACALAVKGGDKVEAARVVLGAVAPRPWRSEAAEKALVGKSLKDEKAVAKAAEAAVEGAKPLRNNGYKPALVKAMVARAAGMI